MAKHKLLIALCGMDGAGKSTIVNRLSLLFENEGVKTLVVHAHEYTLAKRSFGIDENFVLKFRLLLTFLIPLAYIDNLITYFIKYRKVLRNSVIITDRFYYDKLARMLYYKIMPKKITPLYLKLLPCPDFTFFLMPELNSAIQRRMDYDKKKYKDFRSSYTFVGKLLGAYFINTSKPLEKSVREIFNIIKKN